MADNQFLAWVVNDVLTDIPTSLDEAFNPPAAPIAYTFDEVREDIIRTLGVDRFKVNGFSVKPVHCLFHEDKTPSAQLHREKGLYCFTCGQMFTWKQLAGELGIPWTVSQVETPIIGDFIGMSRAERRAFIKAGFTNLARVLDVTIDRELGGQLFTLRELNKILSGIVSTRCTWDAFNQLRGKRLLNKRGGEYLTLFFLSYSSQHKEGKESVKYSPHRKTGGKKGNPAVYARIPTPQEIQAAVKVAPDVHYGMTRKEIASAAEYRAACMADVVNRRPGKYTRDQHAKPLGISYPTIKVYCDRAGIIRTPQPPKLTELTPEDVLQLPENHNALKLAIRQKKVKAGEFMQDERGIKHELTQAGAKQAATMGGGKLYRAAYLASDYKPGEK
jgi:hypothetical protein